MPYKNLAERRLWWRNWRLKNLEKRRISASIYRAAHPEREQAVGRKYRTTHLDKICEKVNRRRAKKLDAFVESVDRRVVFERDLGICGICQEAVDQNNWHLDHIVALSRGGEHSYANTQVTHPVCNLRKGVR